MDFRVPELRLGDAKVDQTGRFGDRSHLEEFAFPLPPGPFLMRPG